MNIADIRQAGKRARITLISFSHLLKKENLQASLAKVPRDVVVVVLLLLSCAGSFGLGILTGEQLGEGGVVLETLPLTTPTVKNTSATAAAANTHPLHRQVVASQNGSKYYLPNCGGAKRLSATHKIWFASAQKARAHGYTPSARCKGL